jgi:hypothetical protein
MANLRALLGIENGHRMQYRRLKILAQEAKEWYWAGYTDQESEGDYRDIYNNTRINRFVWPIRYNSKTNYEERARVTSITYPHQQVSMGHWVCQEGQLWPLRSARATTETYITISALTGLNGLLGIAASQECKDDCRGIYCITIPTLAGLNGP